MKKVVALMLAFGISGNLYAACPSNLNGKWSGSGEESEDGRASDTSGTSFMTHTIKNTLHVLTISGSTVQPNYYAQATSGIFGSSEGGPASPETLALTFDRTTCSGTIGNPKDGGFYFIVSDSGKTIEIIGNEKSSGTFGDISFESGTAKRGILHRQ